MERKAIIQTFILSIAFFIILFIITYITRSFPGNEFKFEPMHLFLALVPFIILLIVSGKLKEIRGPGGISLSLKDEAEKTISPEYEDTPIQVEPEIMQAKGGMDSLRRMITENPPTTLSFQVGMPGYYSQSAILEYIRELQQNPEFQYILFNNRQNRFQGYMMAEDFEKLLKTTSNIVKQMENAEILQVPNVITSFVKSSATNKNALEMMASDNINELAVVDESGCFIGIITQEEIVRKILSRIIRNA